MAARELRTSQIVTGVEMLLTMFEAEFGKDEKYMAVIAKVKESISENNVNKAA